MVTDMIIQYLLGRDPPAALSLRAPSMGFGGRRLAGAMEGGDL